MASEGKKCLRLWFTLLLDTCGDIHSWLFNWKDNADRTQSGWRQTAFERYCEALAWMREASGKPAGFVWVCQLFDVSPQEFERRVRDPKFYNQMRRLLPFVERR